MSKRQKLIIRLLKVPRDFTWDELHAALLTLGFEEISNTKTGGSRRKFYHSKLELIVNLCKFITYWTNAQGHYGSQYTQRE
jgi:hypothetical protein